MGIFKGVATAKNMNGRNEKPKLGTTIALMKKAQYLKPERSNANFVKITLEVIKAGIDDNGLLFGQAGFSGNVPGDVIDVCYFEDKDGYFASDIQKFALAVLATDKKDLGDGPNQTPIGEFEDEILPDILGIDGKGNPTGVQGIFDNATVLELRTFNKIAKPKKEGEPARAFANTVFTKRVPIQEATAGFSDDRLVLLFGSMANYAKAVELDNSIF